MTEKFEEKLWGRIDFLHEKYRKDYTRLQNFGEILTKFQNACQDFAKSLNNAINKKYQIIEEKPSTMYNLIQSLMVYYSQHVTEYTETYTIIKTRIIGPVIQVMDDLYSKEKEMYNAYCKTKNQYNSLKNNLEKIQKEYENNAKLCENILSTYSKLKLYSFNNTPNEEMIKYEEKVKNSIANAKASEEKYLNILEEANKARENEIHKQKELLQYYQTINSDFYVKLSGMVALFITSAKKMYTSLIIGVNTMGVSYKNLNIEKDLNDFILKYKTDLKPEENINFIPYEPLANLSINNSAGNDKKELENLEINYQVLSTMHKYLKDICKEVNFEEEKDKARLRFLSNQIFKIGPNISFKPEEKKELISFLKEKKYRSFFIITLSKQRTKGRFQRSASLVQDLADILEFILELSENEKDYENAKNCIILSQTFYCEVTKGGKKRYLFDYIKKYPWLLSLEFWDGIIEFMVQSEIRKYESITKKVVETENEKEKKNRISNIAFSQVLSYSNNMIEFGINKENINSVINNFVKKYEIDPAMAEAIFENVKNTPLPENEDDEILTTEKYEIVDGEVRVKSETNKTVENNESFNLNDKGNEKKEDEKVEGKEEEKKEEDRKEEEKKIEENVEDKKEEEKKEEDIKEEGIKEEDNNKEENKEEKNKENEKEGENIISEGFVNIESKDDIGK